MYFAAHQTMQQQICMVLQIYVVFIGLKIDNFLFFRFSFRSFFFWRGWGVDLLKYGPYCMGVHINGFHTCKMLTFWIGDNTISRRQQPLDELSRGEKTWKFGYFAITFCCFKLGLFITALPQNHTHHLHFKFHTLPLKDENKEANQRKGK